MIKIFGAVAAICCLGGLAAAFDNSTCSEFLIGPWTARIAVGDELLMIHIGYSDDGTLGMRLDREVDDVVTPGTPQNAGHWLAKPGSSPSKCGYAVTDLKNAEYWSEFTVIDADTLILKGTIYRRVFIE